MCDHWGEALYGQSAIAPINLKWTALCGEPLFVLTIVLLVTMAVVARAGTPFDGTFLHVARGLVEYFSLTQTGSDVAGFYYSLQAGSSRRERDQREAHQRLRRHRWKPRKLPRRVKAPSRRRWAGSRGRRATVFACRSRPMAAT